jgi:formylglycine-generating enzyme required for sulfatase activity
VLAAAGDPRFRSDRWDLPDEPLLGLVKIPAGPFQAGGEEGETTPVTLHDFYMGRYLVTNAQFGRFVKAGGYAEERYWPEAVAEGFWSAEGFKGRWDDVPRTRPAKRPRPFETANHPVSEITWYEMLAYCRWLTEQLCVSDETPDELGRLLREEDWSVCLPSEAEWEKAARGSADSREFPWGDAFDPDLGNCKDTGIGATSAVGCFPRGESPYGCHDMAGNMWEWTRSVYGPYPAEDMDSREDLRAGPGKARVLRGGACYSSSRYLRCACRHGCNPLYRAASFGFRVVFSPFLSQSGL